MALPDPQVIKQNLATLERLDRDQLIMATLAEIVGWLYYQQPIPPGKAVALMAELEKRSGIR